MSEPHIAGHSTHFLRRLDRLEDEQVEIALTLYRDRDLLKEVLGKTAIPHAADRVAISLDDPREGPFVVVTRDGDYVTCLGRGMTPKHLVVTRAELDAASGRVERMREQLASARALVTQGRGEVTRIFRRLREAGPYLAREDFDAVARWEPILASTFVSFGVRSNENAIDVLRQLAAHRLDRTRAIEPLLEWWWHAFWTSCHGWALMNVGEARTILADTTSEAGDSECDPLHTMLMRTMQCGIVAPTARGLWVAAKHGGALIPTLGREGKRRDIATDLLRALSLGTIALSSKKARTPAFRAIGAIAGDGHHGRVVAELRRLFGRDTEAELAKYDEFARDTLFAEWKDRTDLPVRIASPADIPLDVARAARASSTRSWREEPEHLLPLAAMLPWLARAEARDFFLPRRWASALSAPYSIEGGLALLSSVRNAFGLGRPAIVRSPVRVPRNERCPCGRGKKYKRCCGMRSTQRCAA